MLFFSQCFCGEVDDFFWAEVNVPIKDVDNKETDRKDDSDRNSHNVDGISADNIMNRWISILQQD